VQTTSTLRSQENDGLYEVVFAAARAAGEAAGGAVGILDLSARVASGVSLQIEADFAYDDGRRVLSSLETRTRAEPPAGTLDRTRLLADALAAFGGTALTNLSANVPSPAPTSSIDGLDVTVSFGSRLPMLAENLLLPIGDGSAPGDVRAFADVLDQLGVAHGGNGARPLTARRRQLRGSMTRERQIAAYRAARANGLDAALYAAAIPCTQSMRFAETGADGTPRTLDLVLSRGLTTSYTCTERDARDMERLLGAHFGIRFGATEFTLTHTFGDGRTVEEAPRRGLSWFGRRGGRERRN
jgi:hypothetical protein